MPTADEDAKAPVPAEPQVLAPGAEPAPSDQTVTAAAPELPPVPPLADPTEGGKKWTKALVVAGGNIPANEKRPVVVVEVRSDDGSLGKDQKYPQGGDLYLRTDPDTDFGGKADGAFTLGENLEQGLLWGFSPMQGVVHVGPAHPAYAGANLAYLQGATEIEITGLSKFWQEKLQPWFDKVPTDARAPADVKITLT